MQVVHEVCCGLDVPKKSVTACVLWASGRRRQTREFGISRVERMRFETALPQYLWNVDSSSSGKHRRSNARQGPFSVSEWSGLAARGRESFLRHQERYRPD